MRSLMAALGAIASLGLSLASAQALNMNFAENKRESIVYINLWGKIVPGDDEKFRQMVLPFVRSGKVIFKVSTFSSGGNVQAAMGIGEQIRTLNAVTAAPLRMATYVNRNPVLTTNVQCWFWTQVGDDVMNNGPKSIYSRDMRDGNIDSCDCESACFLIWSSGISREGNFVGIHRYRFDEFYFAGLSPMEAKRMYESSEQEGRAYLVKRGVPQSIVDRMFATDSHSMYFLSREDLQLAKSTPFLEELTMARCGQSKARSYWNGNDHISEEDPSFTQCYRGVLKQAMIDGAREYLSKYGP